MKSHRLQTTMAGILVCAGIVCPQIANAHCDTMDGPVVADAKIALDKQDVTPVLKWVNKDGEAEVKAAFDKTVVVRAKGADARELADRFFFETVVRIHRAGEGEPYTGLKPAGTKLSPAVAESDKALDTGTVDNVIKLIADEAAAGIRRRFADVSEKRKHADQSVEAGREFVAAYVEYTHYIEALHDTAQRASAHDAHTPPAQPGAHVTHDH